MKIAIVHDYLNQYGGAERVVEALHEIFPEAPIYTSIYDENRMPPIFKQMDIRTSFMQHLPMIMEWFKIYFPLYPLAFESFDLSSYEVILSSSSAFAKGIKKSKGQLHICYCYTPMRFVWRYNDYVKREGFSIWIKRILPFFLNPIKQWDLRNNAGVDAFIAISAMIAERIRKIYGRESDIIYPPVETEKFKPGKIDGDYYLVASRLTAYKRIDLAVEAFDQLELPLKVIGDGPAGPALRRMAKENIEFLGRVNDQELAYHLANCRALIFPGEEDFGIVPLEAMASGRPVIAFQAGGAKETILEGKTGIFFKEQSVVSLCEAVKRFRFELFDKNEIRKHAENFAKANFKKRIKEYIDEKYQTRFKQP
jgi:glycosyltransferase involved in cell wall biosynthesis